MIWQPGMTLANVEQQVILTALKFYQGNKSQTARSLGIAPNTLASKLDQYEPSKPAPQAQIFPTPAPPSKGKKK